MKGILECVFNLVTAKQEMVEKLKTKSCCQCPCFRSFLFSGRKTRVFPNFFQKFKIVWDLMESFGTMFSGKACGAKH